jgi:hypothetical protein
VTETDPLHVDPELEKELQEAIKDLDDPIVAPKSDPYPLHPDDPRPTEDPDK